MKYLFLLVNFFLLSYFTQGQCFYQKLSSYKETGIIIIKEKVEVEGKSKAEIFEMASTWGLTNISTQYTKPKRNKNLNQIITSNKDIGLFKGTYQINYKYKNGFRYILFDLTIKAEDNYYQYTINSFNMNRKPMEEYLRLKSKDKVYNIAFDDICKKLELLIEDMKNNIK